MLEEFSRLKTLADWGKHQFNASLASVSGWSNLGEQHFLAAKVLLMECWKAKKEHENSDKRALEYGTRGFEVLQKTYFYEPATLSLALSFENFLKGIWVKNNGTNIRNSGSIPELLKTHDLNQLAKECSLILTADERKMLSLLSIFSIWRGKYNLPLKREENIKYWEGQFDAKFLLRKYPGDFSFPEEVCTLRSKISKQLNLYLL